LEDREEGGRITLGIILRKWVMIKVKRSIEDFCKVTVILGR